MLAGLLERIPGTVIVIVLCLCALWCREGSVSLCHRASPILNQQAWTDHSTNRRPAGAVGCDKDVARPTRLYSMTEIQWFKRHAARHSGSSALLLLSAPFPQLPRQRLPSRRGRSG